LQGQVQAVYAVLAITVFAIVSRDIVMDAVLLWEAIFSFLLFLIMIGMDVPGDLIKPGLKAAVP
jgi:hypothetical protein